MGAEVWHKALLVNDLYFGVFHSLSQGLLLLGMISKQSTHQWQDAGWAGSWERGKILPDKV